MPTLPRGDVVQTVAHDALPRKTDYNGKFVTLSPVSPQADAGEDGPEKSVGTEYSLLIGERKGNFEMCLSRFNDLKNRNGERYGNKSDSNSCHH